MQPLRRSFFLLIILSVMICIVIVSHRAVADVDSQGYDRRLPDKAILGLEKMDLDIQNAKRLLAFDSDRIVIEDRNQGFQEYRFAYGILWCNDLPVIAGVRTFHFEYRNAFDHQISPSRADHDLKTIQYTLCLIHDGEDMFVNQSIEAPSVDDSFQNLFAMLDSKT